MAAKKFARCEMKGAIGPRLILPVIAIFALGLLSTGRAQSDGKSIEYQLALVNCGKGYLSADDITVTRFRYLIGEAVDQTGSTPKEIADLACKGQGTVRNDYGIDVTLLSFMERANAFLSMKKMSYQDAAVFTVMFFKQKADNPAGS